MQSIIRSDACLWLRSKEVLKNVLFILFLGLCVHVQALCRIPSVQLRCFWSWKQQGYVLRGRGGGKREEKRGKEVFTYWQPKSPMAAGQKKADHWGGSQSESCGRESSTVQAVLFIKHTHTHTTQLVSLADSFLLILVCRSQVQKELLHDISHSVSLWTELMTLWSTLNICNKS